MIMKHRLLVVNICSPEYSAYVEPINIGSYMRGRYLKNYKFFMVDNENVVQQEIKITSDEVNDIQKTVNEYFPPVKLYWVRVGHYLPVLTRSEEAAIKKANEVALDPGDEFIHEYCMSSKVMDERIIQLEHPDIYNYMIDAFPLEAGMNVNPEGLTLRDWKKENPSF